MKTTFSSRWGLIAATLGMAIGTGNLWRFPRVVAENGGGTFLIPWLIFLFSWSIPLLMVEFALGRHARRGPLGAFAKTFGERTGWRGGFVAVCTLAIFFYYSVVAGWTVRYLQLAITGAIGQIQPTNALETFTGFAGTWGAGLCHLLAMGLASAVVALGVTRGIEVACKVLVPSLFVVLMIAIVRALTLPGSGDGLAFLFRIEPERLGDVKIWLEALSQSAWSTGAGWGLMICYAIYASKDMRTERECRTTGIGNNAASLLAGLAILPAVFALAPLAGQDPSALVADSGPASTGLTFIWMPVLFQELPAGGRALSVLFFLGLFFAALSSLIAMVELGVRTLSDLGIARRRAVAATFAGGFVLGLPSAVNIGGLDALTILENQDWVWGVGLIVSGGLMALTVVGFGVDRFWREFIAEPEGATAMGGGGLFRFLIGLLVPLQFVGLLGWWFYKAWGWSGDASTSTGARLAAWLSPFSKFSIGTCLLQWGIAIALLVAFNRFLARRSAAD